MVEETMKMKKWIAVLTLALVTGYSPSSLAKAVLWEDFSAQKLGADNVVGNGHHPKLGGWQAQSPEDLVKHDFAVYRLPSFDNVSAGAVEFWVKRTRSGARKHLTREGINPTDTVFSLLYPRMGLSFAVGIEWDYNSNGKKQTALTFSFNPAGKISPVGSIWKLPGERNIPIGYAVPVGKWTHFMLTWGANPNADNRVYVNGKLIAQGGRQNFKDILALSDRMVVGMFVLNLPEGLQPMYEGIIGGIAFHDMVPDPILLPAVMREATIASVTGDTFKVAGISGKLVAGDTVTATLMAAPGGKATFDMGDVKGIAMAEVPATEGGPGIPAVDNGTYQGSYTIRPGDDYEDGYIVGHFVSADNVVAEPVSSVSKWTIDTKPVVTFDIDKKDMPADSSTKARVKILAEDANGNSLKGRHFKLTLATTEEYTDTVGAGDFGQNVGATVETRWRGETDAWGEVEFDYIAGFAAKTVILTAKDLDSGGVTVDYITSFKEAAIDIALTPPVNRAAARRGVQYIIKVKASRTELTADGRSRSVIRATVMDPNGKPVSGDPVTFTLSSENGTLRTIKGTTDSSGVATAEYRAGKKIGIVVVTATATLRNASGNVSIILLSDAPAKIYLKARPETLPADGFSRSDLEVKVTDINDNPNQDTKVEFRVAKGGGKLDYADRVTDRFGDATNRYTAGTAPGTASIVATVRSKVPTEAELTKAKNVLFAPYSQEGDEIRVEKWLKRKGESFFKGDPLVEYTIGRGSTVYQIVAPYDGKMGEQFVEYWDDAEVGQTMAVLIPASK
jgi:hypothetical protein